MDKRRGSTIKSSWSLSMIIKSCIHVVFNLVWFSMDFTRELIGKSVRPLVYGTVVEFDGSKVVIMCSLLKWEHVKNGTFLGFYL